MSITCTASALFFLPACNITSREGKHSGPHGTRKFVAVPTFPSPSMILAASFLRKHSSPSTQQVHLLLHSSVRHRLWCPSSTHPHPPCTHLWFTVLQSHRCEKGWHRAETHPKMLTLKMPPSSLVSYWSKATAIFEFRPQVAQKVQSHGETARSTHSRMLLSLRSKLQ